MRKLFKIVPLFVLLILLFSISIASAQDDVPFVPESPITQWSANEASLVASKADIAATQAAWATAELRAAAQATTLPVGPVVFPLDSAVETLGAPGSSSSGAPDPRSDALARQQFPDAWQEIGKTGMVDNFDLGMEPTDAEGTPYIFNSGILNSRKVFWRTFPYRTTGKLRYQNAANQSFYCSASVISSQNVIVTAAHCLYDTVNNRWHKNWRFYPAERNNFAPYGSFEWSAAQILPSYISLSGGYNIGWVKHDVGLIKLRNNSSGRPVTYYTGWMGRTWNRNCPLLLNTVGYPANLPDGSLYTYFNQAECYTAASDAYGQGSNLKSGSSGGPWVYKFRPFGTGSVNQVNAVVSGGPTSQSIHYMWGPRFTTNNIVWLCNQTIVKC